jgi:NADH dehydrogenase
MMKRVLLLGGTGFVGQSLCERLVEHGDGAGLRITVPTRRLARAKTVQFLPTVDPVECDLHDDAQLSRLLAGHDAVVNLVAILHGSAAEFERVHVELPRRLAAACAGAGIRRLIHVSALGIGAEAPSNYLRSKAAGEAVLKAAALELTLLRPSVIFGVHDRFLNLFASLQALFPLLPLAGLGARFQPVWVEDVTEAIVRCLHDPATVGKTFECAGPRIYTLEQLVRLAGRVSGHERTLIALPPSLGRLQAWAMELLPGEPLMSRDNIDSMRVPNVATQLLPGLDALGIQVASLEAVAPTYLAPRVGVARLDRWRALRVRA